MKKKFAIWTSVYTQGNWEEMDPKYWWPSFSQDHPGDNDQGKINIPVYKVGKSFPTIKTCESIRKPSVKLFKPKLTRFPLIICPSVALTNQTSIRNQSD